MTRGSLSPAEISNLIHTYMSNSMARWVTRYFLSCSQDKEVRQMLKYAEKIAVEEEIGAKSLLQKYDYPVPSGFTEQDVGLKTQPLYSDDFILNTKFILAQDGATFYSLGLTSSLNKDVRQYYESCWDNTKNLFHLCTDGMLNKGLHRPEITVPKPQKLDKLNQQSFLSGWFTDRRALNVQEIGQLESCFKSVDHLKQFLKSFEQTSQSQELKHHYQRGKEIMQKQMTVLQDILTEDNLPQLQTFESEITASTVPPFSERLMLFKMTLLTGLTAMRHSTALLSMTRRDLGLHYMRLLTELQKYGEDCINLMIKYQYMDQLPLASKK